MCHGKKCQASIALERKAQQVAKEVAPNGVSRQFHTVSPAMKMYGFHFQKPHKMGHLEVWNHHDIWARDWFWSNYRHHPRTFICKKDGPNGGWNNWCLCWGSIISERIRRIRGQPVFRDFFGASFNKLLRIQAMFPPQTTIKIKMVDFPWRFVSLLERRLSIFSRSNQNFVCGHDSLRGTAAYFLKETNLMFEAGKHTWKT